MTPQSAAHLCVSSAPQGCRLVELGGIPPWESWVGCRVGSRVGSYPSARASCASAHHGPSSLSVIFARLLFSLFHLDPKQ